MMDTIDIELARTTAFILAGGQGERLHPLTESRPKPAVSFGGRFRIVDFTLFNCLRSGLLRVSLLTQYKYEQLHRYIKEGWSDRWSRTLRSRESLLCLPPINGKRYRGTADAIFQNADRVREGGDHVLVLSADHIYQMDYRELLNQHIFTNADLTIAAVEYPIGDAWNFGVLQVDETSRVTGFEEKPIFPHPIAANPSSALVSMGVYVFKKSTLLNALDDICSSGQGFDFGRDIIPVLIRSARTFAYNFRDSAQNIPGYWRDIGTIDAYYAASMDLVRAVSPFDPYANADWSSSPAKRPRTRLDVRAGQTLPRIDGRARVARSVVSAGVEVRENATVYDSVLMPGSFVGIGAQLRRVIVEEGVHVPAGTSVGIDREHDRRYQTVSENGVVVITHEPAIMRSRMSS
jgi:glucose-1-phosphate adenylyltransferase